MENTHSSQNSNQQKLRSLLLALQQNADAVVAHFHQEAIIEYPYAHTVGTPSQLNLSQYRAYLTNALSRMSGLQLSDIQLFQTTDPDVCFAEFHGHVPFPSGDYHQDYVVRATFKEGKVIRYREYWNPSAMTAFGDKKTTNDIFKHD